MSTENAIQSLITYIHDAFNENKYVLGIFLATLGRLAIDQLEVGEEPRLWRVGHGGLLLARPLLHRRFARNGQRRSGGGQEEVHHQENDRRLFKGKQIFLRKLR